VTDTLDGLDTGGSDVVVPLGLAPWRRVASNERLADLGLRIAVLALVFVVWLLATRSADSIFFPLPTEGLPAVWNDWLTDGTTWQDNIVPSVVRLMYGFVLAAIVSIAFGLAIGRSQLLSELVEPTIHFLRAIPPPALLPVFLIIFGIGDLQKVMLIAFGVAPPILLNSIDGARSVETLHLDTASANQIGRRDRSVKVNFPAAAPKVFAGLRVSMSLAVILMVISELVAATDGIGFRINRDARSFAYVDLWGGLVVLALLGILLNAGLSLLERRVLRWRSS
jgi:ABC-type nitrate/sulfonate/bicarbonate transport system permease component